MEPQDLYNQPKTLIAAANSQSGLEKIYKSPLQEILRFLTPHELVRMQQTSKRMRSVGNHDYLWRYLSEHSLPFFHKYFSETWKESYLRSMNLGTKMNKEDFDFEMCPIRHFKQLITAVDTFLNFVFAVDESGNLGIFMIDEKDVENDDNTLQRWEAQIGEKVFFLKFYPSTNLPQISPNDPQTIYGGTLVLVTESKVLSYLVTQTSSKDFEVKVLAELNRQIQTVSNLYVCPVGQYKILICNLPLDLADLKLDRHVHVYDVRHSGQSAKFYVSQLMTPKEWEDDPRLFAQISQPPPVQQNNYHWRRPAFVNLLRNSIMFKKEQRLQFILAVMYPGSDLLLIQLFNKNLLALDPKISELDSLLNRGNTKEIKLPGVSDTDQSEPLPIALHLTNDNQLVSLNFTSVKFFTRQVKEQEGQRVRQLEFDLIPIQHIKTPESSLCRSMFFNDNHAWIIFDQADGKQITLQLDFLGDQGWSQHAEPYVTSKAIQSNGQQQGLKTSVNMTTVSQNGKLMANASPKVQVEFYQLDSLEQGSWFLTAGSKAVKSYEEDPQRPGVSHIAISQSKVVCVLGNLIRVYSFDLGF